MSFHSSRLLVAASLAAGTVFIAPLAAAQTPPIKPGLWEVKLVGGEDRSAQLAERMKNMPPDKRAQMEAMMKEHGIDITAGGATHVCYDKDSMDVAQLEKQTTCKTDFSSRTSSSWKWHSVCSQFKSESDGEAVFTNAENYTINTTTTSTMSGQPKTTKRTMQAKWLGSNCGDLKPFSLKH
jgi:hypothetical protein